MHFLTSLNLIINILTYRPDKGFQTTVKFANYAGHSIGFRNRDHVIGTFISKGINYITNPTKDD